MILVFDSRDRCPAGARTLTLTLAPHCDAESRLSAKPRRRTSHAREDEPTPDRRSLADASTRRATCDNIFRPDMR